MSSRNGSACVDSSFSDFIGEISIGNSIVLATKDSDFALMTA